MEDKTPRVFNRKVNGPYGETPVSPGSDRMRILGAASSEYGGYDEKKESENLVDTDASGRFRKARGSGWIENTHTGLSSNTPNTRNYSAAQSVLEKLQQEVATKPTYRTPSPMARMKDGDVQEAASTPVRYKFVAENKSPSQIKKEKQKKWKQKMKIAQEKKRQEKKALEEGSTAEAGEQFGKAVISCVLDNVEQARFFKNFTRCGDLVEDESVFEETWSASSSAATSDEDRVPRGRSRVPRRPSESSNSVSSMSRESSISTKETNEQESSPSPPTAEMYPNRKPDGKGRSASAQRSNQVPMKPPDNRDRVASPVNQTPSSFPANSQLSPTSNLTRPSAHTASVHPANRASFSRHSASTMTTRPPAPTRERNFITAFMDDIGMGESMLWHQETSVMNPTTITIYLKKGYRCSDGTFCAPRLTWKDERKGDEYEVDLFDILSLKKADTLELANFPYAMPGRTVCMKISNGTWFIFEAKSEEDAYRFVRGIRWVVSRLAFNLVIGNIDVSCELLDLGLIEESPTPGSSVMEFDWSRAMDDVADQMVEKTLVTTMI